MKCNGNIIDTLTGKYLLEQKCCFKACFYENASYGQLFQYKAYASNALLEANC